jgi:hypothetical protein
MAKLVNEGRENVPVFSETNVKGLRRCELKGTPHRLELNVL